ncbi:MAG: hypothetical protein PHV95_09340 [Eubacteriales bacterium]|nr:hypothetical protein [Eubacteriales bacterium]
MKKFLAIFLAALMLVSVSVLMGSAAGELLDRVNGTDLDGTALMIKGDDIHAVADGSKQPVYINKMNKAGAAGDAVILTGDIFSLIGETDEDFKDFAGIVATYNRTQYRYVVTEVLAGGADKSDVEIPADGFALLVSTGDSTVDTWKTKAGTNKTNIGQYKANDTVAVQGLPVGDVKFDFYKTSTAPTLDGIIGVNEYGDAVMEINGQSQFCDYRHFEANDQYATGKFYATYDADYIYLGWEIDSENHYYPVGTEDSGMWAVDCVQINISTINPRAMENLEHFDRWADTYGDSKYMYQIGVGVNENGETKKVTWIGAAGEWEGKATRDDNAGKTIYEAKLPKAAFAVEGYELDLTDGNKIGISFTINTHDGTKQRVIRLRDGGGIFGSNDYSKHPEVTLKGTYVEPVESEEESKDGTPITSDMTVTVFSIIAVIAMAGTVLALKRAR